MFLRRKSAQKKQPVFVKYKIFNNLTVSLNESLSSFVIHDINSNKLRVGRQLHSDPLEPCAVITFEKISSLKTMVNVFSKEGSVVDEVTYYGDNVLLELYQKEGNNNAFFLDQISVTEKPLAV
jgi:uncharacterized protein YkuJ